MNQIIWKDIIYAGLCSGGAAACYSFVFNIRKTDVLPGALFGAIGWMLYVAVKAYTASEAWGNVTGAFAVAAASELCAIFLKRPATVFLVPGIMPLVPGGGIYNMMHEAVQGRLDKAASAGYVTLVAAGSIALGIAVASSVARIVSHTIRERHLRRIREAEKSVPFSDPFSDE